MKTAIVTGASSGLGRALAMGIPARFPEIETIWLVARREERLRALAEEIKGARCAVMDIDIASGAGIARFAKALRDETPDVMLLINCAGYGMLGDFDASEMSEQLGMIDVNVRALTEITRLTLDYMPRGARIINISSIASFVPNARMAVYSATKYYVRAFSRALGLELRPRRISVTAVCPGPLSTEFLAVGKIAGNSRAFRLLPRIKTARVAAGALRHAKLRLPIYTPGWFYKCYRAISALIPDTILMWLART
ncbi:MAG: SDR family NAD(P)-dependent oxidoreductase [Christensenellales bacterium]|jgi:short-subunit dehydrogenase